MEFEPRNAWRPGGDDCGRGCFKGVGKESTEENELEELGAGEVEKRDSGEGPGSGERIEEQWGVCVGWRWCCVAKRE
jgi:hypothetical protein